MFGSITFVPADEWADVDLFRWAVIGADGLIVAGDVTESFTEAVSILEAHGVA